MPIIHIEFDNEKIGFDDAYALARAIQQIVSDVTGIEDVSVCANSAQIKVQLAPVEVFVRMTDAKVTDEDQLLKEIASELEKWKQNVSFNQPINLTLIPMHWKIAMNI